MLQGINTTITVTRATNTTDVAGDVGQVWNTVVTLPARVQNTGETELLQPQGRENLTTHWAIVEGDYATTILPNDRVTNNYDNFIYEVVEVRRGERKLTPLGHTEIGMNAPDDDRFEP